jgi:hypothetical protein
MWQQGQAFKLKVKGRDGQPLWAYRYRLDGRGSPRPQVGGFGTRAEAMKALEGARTARARRAGSIDDARRVGRRVSGDASGGACHGGQAALVARQSHRNARGGQTRRALSEDVYAWRLTIPEGIGSRRRRRFGRCSVERSSGGCSTRTRRSGVSRTSCAGRRRRAVRVVAADRRDRRAAQSRLRADGRSRGGDRVVAVVPAQRSQHPHPKPGEFQNSHRLRGLPILNERLASTLHSVGFCIKRRCRAFAGRRSPSGASASYRVRTAG